jgi:probable HAF family extracellular repeat protein
MKNIRVMCVITATLFALAIPTQLAAQSNPDHKHWHHHYKLINIGTFGGPQNYINGDDLLVPYIGSSQDINNAGAVIGWADTSTLDPNPNFCFNADCYTSHAFQWRNDVRTDLGVLPGGWSSATSWVSANGLIAGASQNGEFDPLDPGYPEDRAVLWRDGKMIDLGTLPEGGYESGAEAVNSRGQVVGWALNTVPDSYSMALFSSLYNFYEPIYPYQSRAFLWQGGAMQDLGTLGTGTDAYAMAINERGQVVGVSYTNSTPNQIPTQCSFNGALIPTQDPFLWENGKMIDLGTLGGTCGLPYWMNNQGQVVGQSDLAGDLSSHPFLWTTNKGMQDMGTLGGSSGSASMITDLGIVVGGTLLAGDNQIDAFLWDGKMHDLGALDGCSYAFAINDFGQVVGNWGGSDCTEGAFLWENGGPMVDLNTLVHSNSGLAVQGAILISDLGEIVGSSVDVNGNSYAILLIPCDENHPGVEGCDYSLVDATTAQEVSAPRSAPSATRRNPRLPRSNRYHILGMADPIVNQERAEFNASSGSENDVAKHSDACPATACSSHHRDGPMCGEGLCLPGHACIYFKGYDLTYKRYCYYEFIT